MLNANHTKQTKAFIRKKIRQQRRDLSTESRKRAAKKLFKRMLQHSVLLHSHIVAGYLTSDNEIDMSTWFNHAWNQGKQCYLPVVIKTQMIFVHYQRDTPLQENAWGILEPISHAPCIQANALEVILLPLVAFDEAGHRLGRGAGLYDRSLSFLLNSDCVRHPHLIGLGYEFQKQEALVQSPWDVPLQSIITEEAYYQPVHAEQV